MTIFLQTKRLILKIIELSDFDNLIILRTDPEVMKYFGKVQTKEVVEKFLALAMEYQKKHGFGYCSVFEKESGAFVGQAGLFHIGFDDQQPNIEVAYRLHKIYWGKGYATELARALIQWGFQHLSVTKLIGLTQLENVPSQHVLEKAGMVYIGKVNYYDSELLCYEIYKQKLPL